MSPIAPDTDVLRELEADTRRAWSEYSASLRDLSGEAYEQAEADSWDALQDELRRLERRREEIVPAGA